MEILTPRPLRHGDRIAVLSPSCIIKPQLIYNTLPVLADRGWMPYVGRHTFDRCGTFAGNDEARYSDLEAALLDHDTRAIFCSRGGYGAVRLLDRLDRLPLRDDPKWIVGYSDISALHALMSRHGIESIHAPMCKHIASHKGTDAYSQTLFNLLEGKRQDVVIPSNQYNRCGHATGRLLGGNLSVTAGLISTGYDVLRPDTILFIEDIAEPVYKIERILYTLRLNGTLPSLRGLIVGRFTNYTPGADNETMEQMIARMVSAYGYPVAFGAPIGHEDRNMPLLYSSTVTLSVEKDHSTIHYEGDGR